MNAKALLERRLASANDALRAAQRDGGCEAIIAARQTRDALLDKLYPPNSLAQEDTN